VGCTAKQSFFQLCQHQDSLSSKHVFISPFLALKGHFLVPTLFQELGIMICMQVNFLTHFLSILFCRWKLLVARGSVFLFGSVWAETKLYYPSIGFATEGKQEAEAAITPLKQGKRL
jgi:hypothetical protein